MDAINHVFRSYYSHTRSILDWRTTSNMVWGDNFLVMKKEEYWETVNTTISKIRLSEGYPVNKFRDLVELTGRTALWNKKYELFFRGQRKDYKDKKGKTSIYPGICRPEIKPNGELKSSIHTSTIEARYQQLHDFIKSYSRKNNFFYESEYALVQHYGIMPTPLIDVTQSLRVAASFALEQSDTGYLYVFGLPYPHGSISHFVDESITMIKLQNSCPPEACRPRYQEGFLVGRLPFEPYKSVGDNLAKRLIGKFYLDNSNGGFWDDLFQPLPSYLLYPENDKYKDLMEERHRKFTELKN